MFLYLQYDGIEIRNLNNTTHDILLKTCISVSNKINTRSITKCMHDICFSGRNTWVLKNIDKSCNSVLYGLCFTYLTIVCDNLIFTNYYSYRQQFAQIGLNMPQTGNNIDENSCSNILC